MRSTELEQLIEDLRLESPQCPVTAHDKDSSMVFLFEDETREVFNVEECKLLLGSSGSVKRLFEALDYPEEVCVELHGLVVDREVLDELEGLASTVDEL